MPKLPIDYANTCFYKIVCRDLAIKDCYVGHTTDFRKRKHSHMKACENSGDTNHDYPVYQFIRANGNWENWDMILIEKHECNDGLEARKKEREFVESLNATLNNRMPSRTSTEWYHENKEHVLELKRERYDQTKTEQLEQMKQYRLTHLDKIKAQRTSKHVCEICSRTCSMSNKSSHEKTVVHIKAVESRAAGISLPLQL